MLSLLEKIFIKDNNIRNSKVRETYGKIAGSVGIISNVFLFVVKFGLGYIFSSMSIMADAINNLSDSATSLVTLVGFKLAGKPADQEHPFGHARIEYLCGIIVSFVIILIGFQLAQSSVDKIINPVMPTFSPILIVCLILSCAVKFWQSSFYGRIAKKINSQTLMATATDSKNDCLSTIVVLLGAVIMHFSNLNIDGYLGLALSLFIMYSGFKLVKETSAPLLGEAPEKELVKNIREQMKQYKEVIGIHDLIVHSYGVDKIFASMHCEVDSNADINQSHNLMDNIESDFKENLGIQLVVHMDPVDTNCPKTAELKAEIIKRLEANFETISIHDFRVVWGIDHSNIVFDAQLPFSEKRNDMECIDIIEKIVNNIDETYRLKVVIDRAVF